MRWGLLLLLASRVALADNVVVDPCACSPNKPHFHRASALTGDWGGLRQTLLEHGIHVQATYAPEVFTAAEYDDVVAGLAQLALDLDTPVAIHVSALGIHGHGLSEQLMDIYGVSNNAADNDVRLFEAWAEYGVGPATLRAGLLSADQEFILAEHSTVLMSGTFGIIALMAANTGGPVYPVAAPAASLRIEADGLTLRAAIYDGEQANNHGIPTALGEALAISEVRIADLLQLGAWHHTVRGNGYYAIVDHALDRQVGAFARFSIAPDQPVSLYVDTGIRFRRKRDFASTGLAFSRTDQGPQTLVEATYQFLVRGWLTIQPDAQLVLQRDHTAAVLATRAVIAL